MSHNDLPDAPPFFTGRIAGWSRRHRWLVLAAWVLIAIFTIGACVAIGPDEDLEESGTGESGEAAELFDDRFSEDSETRSETITFGHPTLTVADPVYQQTVTDLLAELRRLRALNTEIVGGTAVASSTRVFATTTSHYDTGAPRAESPLVSPGAGAQGGDVTFAEAEYATNEPDDVDEELDAIRAAVAAAAEESGFEILIGGGFILDDDLDTLIEEDFGFASLVNLPLTLFILVIALGAVAAAGVPIVIAYLGVAMAAGVVTLISLVTPMASVWIQVVLLMGLAAGIDYALFLFTRYRFERDKGRDPTAAAAVASNTAGKGVLIAAVTTMLAILGMFLVGNPVFTSLGTAAVVTIFVALLVAQTLMPALLSDNLSRWRLPWLRKHNVAIRGSLNRPAGVIVQRCAGPSGWIFGLIGIGALIALAYPVLDFNLGFNGVTSIDDDVESKAAIETLEEDFTLGVLAPAVIVVDPGAGQNIFATDLQAAVQRLTDGVEAEIVRAESAGEHVPFALPFDFQINAAGDTEAVEIPINADTGDQKAIDALNLLRDEIVPAAFPDDGPAIALVSGATAGNVDFRDQINARTPFVIAFVVITAFVILVAMYRSLVIPAIAVVLNLLAVGAAYGVLVHVFQEGRALEGLLDFEATGIIESWLPLFVFSITFGISMDYLTFAIGRTQELYQRGYSTEEAVVEGVRDGFGIVFSAAAIMIAVATVFAFTRDIGLQQFGFTLALAVLFDATIILLVLLPSMMRLAHDRLWYLPFWLDWLPGGPKDFPEREREEREAEQPGTAPAG